MKRSFSHLPTHFFALIIVAFFAPNNAIGQRSIPTAGTYRAIVVFAAFADDTLHPYPTTPAHEAWIDPTVLPAFAVDILSPDVTPPFSVSSLTDFFYVQSNRRFTVYGTTYPSVVTLGNKSDYYTGTENALSRTDITREVLAALEADTSINLDDYDANGDHYLDHLFIVVRDTKDGILCSGGAAIASLGGVGRTERFGVSGQLKITGRSGSYLRYDYSGNIVPQLDLIPLMAHELGHSLWTMADGRNTHPEHLKVDVPSNDNTAVGYGLMIGGKSVRDIGGDATISAPERDQLGWIDCFTPTADTTLTVRDLYAYGDCVKLSSPSNSGDPFSIYLSNRQRVGFFDRIQHIDATDSDHGLMTTGLLVTAARDLSVATLPADNTLELSINKDRYDGDMFGGADATQLTPWTRPNINGRSSYSSYVRLEDDGFQAIDRIRYSGGNEMQVDYVHDFRNAPTIRKDSWMGAETEGQRFNGSLIVTNGATLVVSTPITTAKDLRVDEGATLIVESGASITVEGTVIIERGATVQLNGTIDVAGTTQVQDGADVICDFSASTICTTMTGTDDFAPAETLTVSVYPNPFTSRLTVDTASSLPVNMTVFDVMGREVGRLDGNGSLTWYPDGSLASGTYLLRIEYGTTRTTKTVSLVR